ncbi:MAG: cytidine deaminase [Bacteroidales bacterium]|jgi:cytidine deaminase|nr:cytidine deaminase [Bacteroidales bacterium]MDD2204961.1 cytidine deaminase [Bacteroidales bacterium]MDD3152545.1 cytidine deaminase [Bacteroidales bacterium]MDD3913902.1 cytidine deaminase [Bacteroidales bacterium]MDD4634258.1 cytidine deaminase [Bacteroidales bacterium]
MQIKELKTTYYETDNINELPADECKLINRAIEALASSYAPYSQFRVGAAALLDSGEIIIGSNQENSASPVCICGERVAMFSAKAQYPDSQILKIAITAKTDKFVIDNPVSPCGSCRQALAEIEERQSLPIKVILYSPTGKIYSFDSAKILLPLTFNENRLKK